MDLRELRCPIPSLRALRAKYPRAHVARIGLRSPTQRVALGWRDIDALGEIPEFPSSPERAVDAQRTHVILAAVGAGRA